MMRAVRSAVQAQITKDLAVEVEAEAKKLTIPTYLRNAVTSSYNKELERMGRKIAQELTTPPEGSADA
jgi:ribosomal protein S3AE